jgi:hypothetical protein
MARPLCSRNLIAARDATDCLPEPREMTANDPVTRMRLVRLVSTISAAHDKHEEPRALAGVHGWLADDELVERAPCA